MTSGFWGGENTPTVFYSRRIGLENGVAVPIVGGGRVTGKIGAFDVGAILTNRSVSTLGSGSSRPMEAMQRFPCTTTSTC